MDLGSIFFILGILTLVILFISLPFIKPKTSRMIGGEQKMSSLLAEQERIINALLELDFDHNLGKIPEEDYPTQRRGLLTQGALVMHQLDTFRAESIPGEGLIVDAAGNSLRADSSKASIRKGRGGKRPLTTPDDDLEVLLAARRRERGEKAGGFCSQCGNPIQQSDRFCPRCGESLSPVENKTK